jgi:hypothetical protein
MNSPVRKTFEARKRLANDEATKLMLEAALRLMAREFEPETVETNVSQEGDHTSAFFSWLSYAKVAEEAQREGNEWINPSKIRDRWPFSDAFIEDLLSYSLWEKHWRVNIEAAETSAEELASASDLAAAIHAASYRETKTVLSHSNFPVSLVMTAIGERYPFLREAMGKSYDLLHRQWVPIYRELFHAYGLTLRPGVTFEELADILSALSEGIAIRIKADPQATFVDDDRQRSLLGRAALMLIAGCVDRGDELNIEKAVCELVRLHSEDEESRKD